MKTILNCLWEFNLNITQPIADTAKAIEVYSVFF